MLHNIVRQRHIKEAVHREDQLNRERDAKLAQARADMMAQREQQRERLLGAFEQVWAVIFSGDRCEC